MDFGALLFVAAFVIPIFYLVDKAGKKKNDANKKQKEAWAPINAHFSYDRTKKHLVVKERSPENAQLFGVKDYKRQKYSDVPAKLVYTGATVGGITTGGVHISGGYTAVANGEKSGKCILLYSWYEGDTLQTDVVETIGLGRNINYDHVKKSKISKYLFNKKIVVVEEASKDRMARSLAAMKMDATSSRTLNWYEYARIDDFPTEKKCMDIVAWICGVD